VFRKDKN